jgi:long-chain fatty acid transport protein
MGKHRILGTTALVALVVSTTQALAGGFAVREQSAWGEGSSYAGVAAGGSVSAMFWNPATITQTGKFALESVATLIFPEASQTGTATFLPPLPFAGTSFGFNDGTPNSFQAAVVPSGYATLQLTDRVWAGFSLNSPFGLSTEFQNPNWAGAFYGQTTTLRTYNAAPTIAIKITDWLSVGAGAQMEYDQVNLPLATGVAAPGNSTLALLTGHGWGFGWTAGATLTPTPWTQIGLGYRSAIDQNVRGSFNTNGVAGIGTPGAAFSTLKLPDSASLGVRQGLTPSLTLLGTVEWTGWKRIGTVIISQPSNGAVVLTPLGAPVTLPFQFSDGWFYSVGLEYVAAPNWTLRGGVGFEKSPVTDQVRIPLLPDNDRTWFSVGATNKLTNIISVDLAYSFVDVKNTPVNVVPGNPFFNGLVTYTGTSRGNSSIFSLGVKFKLDEPPPAVAARG